jgi:hypothetical protein
MDHFPAVVYHAGLEERQQPVGPHLGVNPQMAMALESGQDGVWNGPNPHLEGGSVLDERRSMVPNRVLLLARWQDGNLRQGLVVLHQPVELVDVDEAVTVHPRHVTIDLRDHDLGGIHGRSSHVYGHAQAAIATPVGRGYLNEGDIERPASRAKQLGDLGEKARQVVDAIPVELAAPIVADE